MENRTGSAKQLEQAAWRDLLRATPAPVKDRLHLAAEERGGALILRSATDTPVLNRAIGLGARRPVTEEDISEITSAFRRVGAGRFFVHLPRDVRPQRAAEWLAAQGLTRYRRSWVTLRRNSAPLPPSPATALRIVPASPLHAKPLGATLAAAFDAPPAAGEVFTSVIGRPGWDVYVALDGDRVAAGGALFCDGTAAYLAFSATAPSDRCRGAQRGLMHARLAAALARGVTQIFTETGEWREDESNHSYKNMLYFGFRAVSIVENWAPAGTLWEHGTRSPAATTSKPR